MPRFNDFFFKFDTGSNYVTDLNIVLLLRLCWLLYDKIKLHNKNNMPEVSEANLKIPLFTVSISFANTEFRPCD